jgi:glycosyltransferase involved in cell wall biosynthesis
MRFAFVDTTLTTPPTGGCQTFLEHLAPALGSRGHDVTVLTEPGPALAVADRLVKVGVRVLDDVWPRRFLPEERATRLADWCRRERIEAYIVSVSRDVGWLALPHLDPLARTAAVVHWDGPAFYAPLAYYGVFIDCAIGVSRETCRNITGLCKVPESRTSRIPYGVERFSEAELAERVRASHGRSLEVAYIGRLVQTQKRVLDLAPLASELARRKVPFVMHIVGSGGDAPRLRVELARARVAHHVRWWGWLTPAEVQVRLSQLDALVLPSDSEGLPFVVLEAMGHGVVPVATRIPSGNTELVRDGENGFLAAVGDTKALADHLEKLYRDPALLSRLRRAAWLTSADYSVERMASAYERCLAAEGERAPHPSGAFAVMPSCRSNYPVWLRRVKWRLSGMLARALRPPRYRARRQL